jgi:hypothetical protein
MKYNYLYNKAKEFYKLAGLLQYPIKMHQEILDWASSIYCSYILKSLEELINEMDPESLNFKKAIILKTRLSSYIKYDVDNVKSFKLNLDDISFLEKEVAFVKQHAPNVLNKYVTVVFNVVDFTPSEEGDYNPKSQVITINKEEEPGISESNILAAIKHISQLIRHELQHLVQFYARELKAVADYRDIGMPSIKIAPYQEEEEEEKIKHHLRNIEFYTNLSDTKDNLEEMFRLFPKSVHRFIFDTCIGEIQYGDFYKKIITILKEIDPNLTKKEFEKKYRRYLDILNGDSKGYSLMKTRQSEKYNKLVKELYKSLSEYL